MPYTWVTDPPVRRLAANVFIQQIGAFRGSLGHVAPGENTVRVVAAIGKILDAMRDIADDPDVRLFAYMVDGFPVGLLIMSGGMAPKIDEMVGHPGAEGAGSILTEFAINSTRAGTLSLDSLNKESTGFWTAMGFEKTGELHVHGEVGSCKMQLKAASSDKWQSVGGQWRLKKYLPTPNYLTTVD